MSTMNPPRNSILAPMERQLITKEERQKRLNSIKIRKEDMNKLVMDFLVTEGYVEAAECFQLESGTEHIDISASRRAAIRRAIQSGILVDAIEKIEDLNPMLLETDPTLMFKLQQQRLIELIRNDKIEEGLEFAQKALAPLGEMNPHLLPELERTILLLAFKDVSNCAVRELLDESWRFRVANEVNSVILTSQRQAKNPMLVSLLKLLMDIQGCLSIGASYP